MTADTLDLAPVRAVLADHPVTNAEYRAFLAGRPGVNPDWEPRWPDDDAPAVRVSYHDALAYCAWAGVRLPTDTEWQAWAESLPADDPRRWVDERSVWEWTSTPWDDGADGPAAPRVVRGGSRRRGASHVARAAFRVGDFPGHRLYLVGFRVVRAAPGALASGVTGVPTDDAREVAEFRAERDRLARLSEAVERMTPGEWEIPEASRGMPPELEYGYSLNDAAGIARARNRWGLYLRLARAAARCEEAFGQTLAWESDRACGEAMYGLSEALAALAEGEASDGQ